MRWNGIHIHMLVIQARMLVIRMLVTRMLVTRMLGTHCTLVIWRKGTNLQSPACWLLLHKSVITNMRAIKLQGAGWLSRTLVISCWLLHLGPFGV